MDRLTKWNGEKYILPQGRTSDGKSYWRLIAEKLARYENLGTVEELKALKEQKNRDLIMQAIAEAKKEQRFEDEQDLWMMLESISGGHDEEFNRSCK